MRYTALRIAMLLLLPALQANAQSTIRFGVLGLFHPRTLELSPVRSSALRVEGLPAPLVLTAESGNHHLLLQASGDRILVSGAPVTQLHISARDGSPVRFQLTIPGKLHRIYMGTLTVTASRGEIVAVVSIDSETAVATIVASEMPIDAPAEALRAQSVVTRSFLTAGSRHAAFDFCDTTHCQFLRSPDDITPRVRTAVEDTRGLVLTWNHHVLSALYASRCGGQTRTLRDAGFNGDRETYPYYPVACKWCREHPIGWQTRLPAGATTPEPDSEPSRIAHARQWGWSAFPGNTFTVEHDGIGTLINGRNIGHGLGLCQLGAIGMASTGADFRSILAHYFPDTGLAPISRSSN